MDSLFGKSGRSKGLSEASLARATQEDSGRKQAGPFPQECPPGQDPARKFVYSLAALGLAGVLILWWIDPAQSPIEFCSLQRAGQDGTAPLPAGLAGGARSSSRSVGKGLEVQPLVCPAASLGCTCRGELGCRGPYGSHRLPGRWLRASGGSGSRLLVWPWPLGFSEICPGSHSATGHREVDSPRGPADARSPSNIFRRDKPAERSFPSEVGGHPTAPEGVGLTRHPNRTSLPLPREGHLR